MKCDLNYDMNDQNWLRMSIQKWFQRANVI